jgi:hypothetical protein
MDMIEKELNGRKLRIYSCGKIESFNRNNWRILSSKPHIKKSGYKLIKNNINQKTYILSRVIYWAFNNFDIDNPTLFIDHINRDPTDNRLCNLRVVTHQENQFNKIAKGYTKHGNKYQASIRLNSKDIYLGRYDTEDEARQVYLQAKEKYHIFTISATIVS